MNEVWKDVPKYIGFYQSSNTGIIRSLDRHVTFNRKGATTMFRRGRILSGKFTWDGYNEVCLIGSDKKRKYVRTHRVIALTFIDNKNNKPEINHIDGNKLNNNIKNLEWVTTKENNNHAIKNGLIIYAKGEQMSNLKEEEVLKIRELYKNNKLNQRQIAKKYNVGKNCIWHIIHRKTWKHI